MSHDYEDTATSQRYMPTVAQGSVQPKGSISIIDEGRRPRSNDARTFGGRTAPSSGCKKQGYGQ